MLYDRRQLLGYLLDVSAFASAGIAAFELRFDGTVPATFFHALGVALCVWVAAKSIAFLFGAVRWGHWRYTSVHDAARILAANTAGSLTAGLTIFLLLGARTLPRSIYILEWLIACCLTLGLRLVVRLAVTARGFDHAQGRGTRTLVYGAGSAGQALVRELLQNRSLLCDVIGLIDDDPRKSNLVLQGKRVLGTGETLAGCVRKRGIKQLLIALPSATGPQMVRILKLAGEAKVTYKMVPGLGELLLEADLGQQIRDVAVEDLLGRKPVQLDLERIRERIQGKVVLVTGAAGSIGSEICRQVARFYPLAIVGFDEAETPLFHLDREMGKCFPDIAFYPEIGTINRPDCLRRVMVNHRPSTVYHAAAYKHVPLMEKHVFSAVDTNIFGTWNVARAAIEQGVEDFVLISTDKAVRPTSMMGATKRAAELMIRALQTEKGTKFVVVRFGNVLGSNGSVVPIFKEQIATGGPITVTHPEIRRYFMTIPEAARLVLQAFSIGKGGEIFVLDMGEPVKIADLAKSLILLSGLEPGRDIEIRYTGLRPGEKMFEELNLKDERLVETSHSQIKSYVSERKFDSIDIQAALHRLSQISLEQDVAGLVMLLKELIPDYNPGADLLRSALSPRAHAQELAVSSVLMSIAI